MVRALALFLLITFALLRFAPTRVVQLTTGVPRSSVSGVKTPDERQFTLERTVARTSVIVQSGSQGKGVVHASAGFLCVSGLPSTVFSLPAESALRLVDRRALIRQLGRVQDRSAAPPSV